MRAAVLLRYGLAGRPAMSVDEVAAELHETRVEVRRIESRALRRARGAAGSGVVGGDRQQGETR